MVRALVKYWYARLKRDAQVLRFKLSYYNEYKSYLRHDYIDGYVYKQLINGVKVSRCRVVKVVDWKFSSAHSHIILIASNSGLPLDHQVSLLRIMEELPSIFIDLLKTTSLEQKHLMLKALSENIKSLENIPASTRCSNSDPNNTDIQNLVEHVEDIGLDKSLYDSINKELASLQLKKPGRGVKTKWLVPSSDNENFESVFSSPKPIAKYPNICKLMEIVNNHPSTTGDMNSCLVSRFPSYKATLSLHSDNENIISQGSSICTVSFGAPRNLQFVINGKVAPNGKRDLAPDLVLPAVDKTMNIMKPGAQKLIKHAVGQGEHTDNPSGSTRFSLSFRRVTSEVATCENNLVDDVTAPEKPKRNVVLVAGDSFPARLKSDLLGKGKKDVRNIAKGGRKIDQVRQDICDFIKSNPELSVSKVFISVGANDIRYCENSISHLKNGIKNLMRTIKDNLPNAKIWFQSILPIHPMVLNIYPETSSK